MIERLFQRMTQKLMSAEALGILLIILALFTFIDGITSSLRNTDTQSIYWICFVAVVIGYGLAKIRVNGILASVGIAALGILYIWILGARLTQPLLDLLDAVLSVIPQWVPAIRSRTSIDTTAISAAWKIIAEASSVLALRFQAWMFGFNITVTINDALIRNMVWTLVLLLCSAWMGWFAARRSPVTSLFPSMALLAIVTSYSERRIESLWVVLVLLLVLMGVWNYRNHTLDWLKRRIDFSDSIRVDNSQAVIFLTIAIGTFAIITPSISWRDIIDYVRERQEKNKAAEMLGIQPPRGSGKPAATQQPTLPRDHLLEGGSVNSEQIVMTIRTGELPPTHEGYLTSDVPRYHWRSTVYDRYVGAGWVTSTVFPQSVSADVPLIPGLLSGYHLLHMDVRMVEPEGRLFWSGNLFSASIPITVNWRIRPSSDLFADQSTLLLTDMFAVSTSAKSYQAETYVPTPTVNDLRSAPSDYPEEIRLRYLSLPSTLPDRVRDLAHEITHGLTNPYEKAKAIETYLRKNYPYTLDIPPPPEGRDVADYFLFDLKKGYCDYYATSMVVLARANGLPARFVSGYSPGSYDASNAQYVIREENAHSWTEIFFPGIGWVEFEPTASLPEIERRDVLGSALVDQGNEETASKLLNRFRFEQILLWSSPSMIILAIVILYFAFIERWLVLRLAPEVAIHTIYQRFYRAGRPIAGEWTQAETSSEFLHKFLSAIREHQHHVRFQKMMTDLASSAAMLTNLYHTSLFVEHHVQKQDAINMWQTWKRMRGRLFNAKLLLKCMHNAHNKAVRPSLKFYK